MAEWNSYQGTIPGGFNLQQGIQSKRGECNPNGPFAHVHVMNFSISIFGLPNSAVRQRNSWHDRDSFQNLSDGLGGSWPAKIPKT